MLRKVGEILLATSMVLIIVVGSKWLVDFVTELSWGSRSIDVSSFWQAAIGYGLFMLGSIVLYAKRHAYLPVRTIKQSDKLRPRKVLVLFVSRKDFDFIKRDGSVVAIKCKHDSAGDLELTGELAFDTEPHVNASDLIMTWNWQQLLRAIQVHVDQLKAIHLIGSVGQRGSFDQLEDCKEFLRNYVSTDCAITFDNKGIDFESIGEMTRRLKSVLKKYKRQGFGYDDVMIDVTGGMKTTSIAAAMITLRNRKLRFQYVPTLGGSSRPIQFNVVAENYVEMS